MGYSVSLVGATNPRPRRRFSTTMALTLGWVVLSLLQQRNFVHMFHRNVRWQACVVTRSQDSYVTLNWKNQSATTCASAVP